MNLKTEFLADHPEILPTLKTWFETEWPDYYGADGPGDAALDVKAYSGRTELPIGLVAFVEGELAGIAALRADSVSTHRHLTPWVGAGLVAPGLRRRGIGARLISALEEVARELGYLTIYCATATAASLLERGGWQFLESVEIEGKGVGVYRKVLE